MGPLLALFIRSIRDDLRSKSLLWARIGIAVAILFAIVRTDFAFQLGGAPGLAFFSSVVWMNFLVICIAGLSYFASSVTEEKEENTLGLLRMTDLSPLAILLGKSTSRLIGGLLLLLVQMPFVMLAITMGGVSLDQVLKCYALLGAFLFFACNIGLLGSVIGRRTGSAAAVSAVLGGIYLVWPTIAGVFVAGYFQGKGNAMPVVKRFLENAASAFYTPSVIGNVLGTGGGLTPIGGALSVLFGGGLAAFVIARLCFERCCHEEATVAGKSPQFRKGTRNGVTLIRSRLRRDRAWNDAVAWRDFHYIHGGPKAMVIKFILYTVAWTVLGFSGLAGRGLISPREFFAVVLPVSFLIAGFESLFSTSRIYRLERRNKTLSSLYILPQDIDELIRSKRRAVLLSLVPALFFVAISSLALAGPFLQGLSPDNIIWVLQGLAFIAAQAFLLHYFVALFSLKMKWGGLPLALVLWWLGTSFVSSLFLILFRWVGLFFLIITATVIAIFFRLAFRRRLIATVAEE